MRNFLLSLVIIISLASCKTISNYLGDDEDVYADEAYPGGQQVQTSSVTESGLYPYGYNSNTSQNTGYYAGNAINTGTIETDDLPFGDSTYNKRKQALTNYASGNYYGGSNDETVRVTYDENGNEIRDRVFFNYNSSDLTEQAKSVLTNQINWLKNNSSNRIVIEGHADERGTREYNLALGEKRAQAVKSYMIINGIDRDRISTVSYGKEQPAVVGSNEYSWSKNRRSVTVLR